jgi:hypothetical protein
MQTIKTLYNQPLITSDGVAPTTIKVIVPNKTEYVGAVPSSGGKALTYVLWDVLPEELKQRVVTAIQAITAAM